MSWFSDSPLAYVEVARLGCALLSLSVVLVGFRAAEPIGLWAAVLTGGFCAIWSELLWFAPAVMTEALSAHCALIALWYGGRVRGRALGWVGAGLALSACLRFQYAPALAIAAFWMCRLQWTRWRFVLAGAAPVLLLLGSLDWLTLGSPLQSIWLNVSFNALHGVASAMGVSGVSFFPAYLHEAFWPAALLLPLAVLGAQHAPVLAVTACAVFLTHSFVPHKEPRFIYLCLSILPILIGLGFARVVRAAIHEEPARWLAALAALGVAAILSRSDARAGVLADRWDQHRATVEVLRAVHDKIGVCGVAVTDRLAVQSGGYTYLHRDVPFFLGEMHSVFNFQEADGSLPPAAIMLDGRVLTQRTSAELRDNPELYNALIAEAGAAPPAYTLVSCFDDSMRRARKARPLCLYERPGGCAPP